VQPTDMQFPPGESEEFFVFRKAGKNSMGKSWKKRNKRNLKNKSKDRSRRRPFRISIFIQSLERTEKIYLNYVSQQGKKDISRIAEWTATLPNDLKNTKLESERILMELEQPF
jgi:hypothetical protein